MTGMKKDTGVTFTSKVSFEMVWKTALAWVLGGSVKHTNIQLEVTD